MSDPATDETSPYHWKNYQLNLIECFIYKCENRIPISIIGKLNNPFIKQLLRRKNGMSILLVMKRFKGDWWRFTWDGKTYKWTKKIERLVK